MHAKREQSPFAFRLSGDHARKGPRHEGGVYEPNVIPNPPPPPPWAKAALEEQTHRKGGKDYFGSDRRTISSPLLALFFARYRFGRDHNRSATSGPKRFDVGELPNCDFRHSGGQFFHFL